MIASIDLRSDTVTRPSPAMRRAMAEAEVGDDVLDGDPTTRRLEARVAELLGQEAALFFPSGTQANQTGIAVTVPRGRELVLEAGAHLYHYEMAGLAALWGVQARLVTAPDGILTAELVAQKDIDAVMVSTPDHTHAVISLTAMRLGKHVCTEKPLAHSVHEARILAETGRTTKIATQLDNEGHSAETMRQLVELIRHGAIGEVREVHIWAHVSDHRDRRPPPVSPPAHLNWDLWLGPAPTREYHEGLHPMGSRGWWDFGTSVLGDFGCHYFDAAILGLGARPSDIRRGRIRGQQPRRLSSVGRRSAIYSLLVGIGGRRSP